MKYGNIPQHNGKRTPSGSFLATSPSEHGEEFSGPSPALRGGWVGFHPSKSLTLTGGGGAACRDGGGFLSSTSPALRGGRVGFLLALCTLGSIPALAQAAPGHVALAPPAAVGQSAALNAPYVLSPDDQLSIGVLGHPDLTESVVVLPDGTFRYPIVGSVHAAGMTVRSLTQTLTQGLSTDLNQPEVTVTVVQTRPRLISVLGDVHTPGQYPVKDGEHLLDVLAACGGPAQPAQLTSATLVTDNGTKSMALDVPGLMNNTDMAENIPVEAGDVLLVQARDASVGQCQVIGEVQKAGSFPDPTDGLTVATLLAQTGGPLPDASLTHAQIMHDGTATDEDLRPLLSNLNASVGQTRLMPGDVLLVPVNQDKVGILGEVREPQDYLIPDGQTLTIAQAVSLAGGPTNQASRSQASIIRKGPDGKPIVIPVNIDAMLAGKTKVAEVTLRPGDILYVPTRHQAPGFNPLNYLGLASTAAVLARQ
jgi:polysaccharide export outer membrane protein